MTQELFDKKARKWAAAQEKKLKCLEERPVRETLGRDEGRDEFERDYARTLYSSSFRRLQGKMQLLGIDSSHFHRNRLTHSLEVAQIARNISKMLGLKHPVVAEAASLAHDIGNPPYGHKGEKVLETLTDSCGGFEGNAQTFRVLRKLEKKHWSFEGLNLTMRTLFAVVKYNHKRSPKQKKYLYDEDYEFLSSSLQKCGLCVQKSIDAQIMDVADEIAYAAHDLEDALSFNMVTLDEIIHEFSISSDYKTAYPKLKEIAQGAQKDAFNAKRLDTSEEYSAVRNKELTSRIVHSLVTDLDLVGWQLSYKEHSKLAEGLKKLLFRALLRKNEIQQYELRGEKVIKGLFAVYTDPAFNSKGFLFPPELRNNTVDPLERVAADYISGMMDSFAEQQYVRFYGKSSLDALYGG
ncbi:dNTP triphosphohydrolase [Chlorobium phaeovibrioides]|uniref:DNTP triphosphohydrolase n=1 Tax=Chlorobium phaeovibrioides TaxID=1094 RepID=A0A5M8I9B3_CHLPH|nr:dNTP triphosphohydrolase [Chlorobium phaeovibrioides]KAA6232078.1 dNTP triphosphohydrolase [Chlorobium phaeovibrioides]